MDKDQNRHFERAELTPQADHFSPGESAVLPAVSVVMPVRDEERHLADSVGCVLEQEYPGGFELILAVGPSRDRTEAIARASWPPPTAGSRSWPTRRARSPRP